MRRFHIKVIPGDRVTVAVSPYDPTHGLIVYRSRRRQRTARPEPAAFPPPWAPPAPYSSPPLFLRRRCSVSTRRCSRGDS
jgi:hypothetical protein